MKCSSLFSALCALGLGGAASIYGQAVNSTILGTVADSSGAVVANAKVTATETATNSVRTAQTNESGNFTFPNITPGLYSVSAEAPGFKRAIQSNVNAEVNASARVDFQLQPGNISESIEVTDAPPPLQTDRADTGRKIDTVQTENLPLGTNRNYQNLLNLVPGTTRASFQHSQFFNAASSLQTQVNGQMRMGNNYQIEGIDDNERTGLLQILIVPVEAIQTVDVSTSNFDAELGRATGAVTNVLLKSGSNNIHGGAYEFVQNSALNARNYFDVSLGHRAYNYYGGNIGGPVNNNFAGFLLDLPSTVGRDLGGYFPAYRQWEFFAFASDKWQVSQKLTLDIGLRWEYYAPATPRFDGGFSNYNNLNNTLVVAGVGGNPRDLGMQKRFRYFAPRLGAAYRFDDKTVIRAGFGISYTPFPDNTYAYNYPVRQNNVYNPAVPSYGPALLPNGTVASFRNGLPAPILAAIPANGIITNPDPNTAYFTIDPKFRNPYVETWNLSVQRSLPMHFTLDMAYVGSHGVDSVVNYNLNATTKGTNLGNAGLPQAAWGRTASDSLLFAGYSTSYHSLQVKLDRRFAAGLSITTAYTWGKGMGFQSGDDGGLGQNWYINQQRNYARNDFDRTHTFVQSYVYDLPFGPGKRFLSSGPVSQILGGWKFNGILTLMTGTPLTIGASGTSLNTPGNNQTADQVKPVNILHGINIGNPWFDPTAFTQPTAPGVFGNTGRNIMNGPGFYNLDASLFKVFSFRERYKTGSSGRGVQCDEHPQFNNPNTGVNNYNADPSKNTFGVITGAGGGRGMQLGARMTF